MWYSMQLQERMVVLDREIKDLRQKLGDPKARKSVTPADSAGLAEKQLTFASDMGKAVKSMDRCVDLMTWNMQPIQIRQQILLKFDQAKMAEDRVRALLKADPNNSQLRDLLVQTLEAQGKRKEAQQFLQGGVPMLPGAG
jgi:predicted Zn-dependent protease